MLAGREVQSWVLELGVTVSFGAISCDLRVGGPGSELAVLDRLHLVKSSTAIDCDRFLLRGICSSSHRWRCADIVGIKG